MKLTNFKKLIISLQFLTILFLCSSAAVASDYKYKVLDVKYNPAAAKLIDGTKTEVEKPVQKKQNKKGFDFLRFLAILVAIMFPYGVIRFSLKTFNSVIIAMKDPNNYGKEEEKKDKNQDKEEIKPENKQLIKQSDSKNELVEEQKENNIKIPVEEKVKTKEISATETTPQIINSSTELKENTNIQQQTENNTVEKSATETKIEKTETLTEQKSEVTKPIQNITPNEKINDTKENVIVEKKEENNNISNTEKELIQAIVSKKIVTTKPINSQNPILLNTANLNENQGLCIVEYQKKYSLIGFIGEQIFLLNQFDRLRNAEIRPRYTETVNNKDRYIVRLGTEYKALIEVDEKDINLLIEL